MYPLSFCCRSIIILFILTQHASATDHVATTKNRQWHIGRLATSDDIAEIAISVRPDGKGLPSGQGTAKEGEELYEQHCQACHGASGEGGLNDALVGRIPDDGFPFAEAKSPPQTIGNYWPFATTIFDYIRRAMPYHNPGKLSDNEIYSLTAYLLYKNNLISSTQILDARTLTDIIMPTRHRLVDDIRAQSSELN